jgi:hypothetical protein
MVYRLNGIGWRNAIFDFIVISVIFALMVLVSALLLLSATILAPAALFQAIVYSVKSEAS